MVSLPDLLKCLRMRRDGMGMRQDGVGMGNGGHGDGEPESLGMRPECRPKEDE